MKNSETSIKNTDRLIITKHALHNRLAESDKTTLVRIKLETLHFHLSRPKAQAAQAKLEADIRRNIRLWWFVTNQSLQKPTRDDYSLWRFFYRLICSFKISHTCFLLSSCLPNNPKEDALRSPTIDHTITESLSTWNLPIKFSSLRVRPTIRREKSTMQFATFYSSSLSLLSNVNLFSKRQNDVSACRYNRLNV